MTERTGYIDASNILTPAAQKRVNDAKQTQKQQPDYRKARKVESALTKYTDNDFYDPDKRKEIIATMKKESARAKRESKKTDKAGVKPRLLEFAERADALRKQLESGERDAISIASVGIDNSKFNFGFDTQGRIDRGAQGLSVDDILAGKKASIDMNNPAEMFDITRESLSKALGKSYRVRENSDGTFTVRTPSGTNINISAVDGITMSPELIEAAWGKEQADRVRRGDAAIAGSFDLSNSIPLIELSRGIATDFTANHEMFHAVAAMALSPEQMRTLQQRFSSEEAMADGYAEWRQGRAQETSTIRAIFRRISDFLSGIRSMFTGENFEDIFRSIESGRVWEQGVSQSGSFREPSLIGRRGAAALDAADGQDTNWNALNNAREMERQGRSPEEIWRETGWERDQFNGWIAEIADNPTMTDELYVMYDNGEAMRPLPDVLRNPRLYEAYPELRDINVIAEYMDDSKLGGFYRERENSIYINTNERTRGLSMRNALLHEVQHAIQRLEGMPGGYNNERARGIVERTRGGSLTDSELDTQAMDMYYRSKGEVDARNAARRQFLTEEERRIAPPSWSVDVDDGVWASYREGRSNDNANGVQEHDTRGATQLYRESQEVVELDRGGLSQEASRVDGGGTRGSYEGNLDRLNSAETHPTRRPSIVQTSEDAKREGERVVSEGEKNRNRLNQYLEPNGGTGIGQRILDKVVPLLFNSNRMVGRVFGWDVHAALERGLATAPGKAVYKIGNGDADAGVRGIPEIVGDIPQADRNRFETIAAYYNLRDIAGDRRRLMEYKDSLLALAKDEKNNAKSILSDLRKNQAIFSGEEIRAYEDAAEGSRAAERSG